MNLRAQYLLQLNFSCLEFAANTKITDFDMPTISDQQVFWFDVSMDDVL